MNRNLLLKLSLPAVLFFLTISSTSLAVTADQTSENFLWEVKSDSASVFLFGSVHLADNKMYPLSPIIEESFEKSDKLVVELNMLELDQMKYQTQIMKKGYYQGDETIKPHLNEEVYKLLKEYLEKHKLPLESMIKMKPGLLSMQLTLTHLMKIGYSPQEGLDFHFLQKAKGKKEILELETLEDQMKLFFEAPNENAFMKYSIISLQDAEAEMNAMIAAWKTGDHKRLEEIMITEPLKEYPELLPVFRFLFIDRNYGMTKKIQEYLKTEETYFVVVGAGHLVGDEGIINLLKKEGFKPKQM